MSCGQKNTYKTKISVSLILIAAFIISLTSGCNMISIRNDSISKKQWIKDLEFMRKSLPKKHINLFAKITEEEFNNEINKLENNIGNLSSEEITVNIMELMAKIGDSHTTIVNYKSNTVYPIKSYWFKEGLFVTNVDREYKDILGFKIVKINNIPVEEVMGRVKKLIPHENEYMLKTKNVELIQEPKVLKYLNISDTDEVTFTLKDLNEDEKNIKIIPKQNSKIEYLNLADQSASKPLYMKKSDPFWYEYIDKEKILYCQRNVCVSKNIADTEIIKDKEIDKLVIDLRNNSGGVHFQTDKFISEISKNEYLNKPDKLYVIVGRNTFSSGMQYALDFKELTNATIIGEPTMGKPSHYGAVKSIVLPNSKIKINYSTKYFECKDYDLDSLVPDYRVERSIRDYIEGIDPVMEKIKN